MSTIYLTTVFGFLFVELLYLIQTKEKINQRKLLEDLDVNNISEKQKSAIFSILTSFVFVVIVVFGGLLTDYWALWLVLLLFSIVVVGPLTKVFGESSNGHIFLVWFNSLLGFLISLFVILNEFHFKLDISEIVKNFF